jgi:hypothetical protein
MIRLRCWKFGDSGDEEKLQEADADQEGQALGDHRKRQWLQHNDLIGLTGALRIIRQARIEEAGNEEIL